MKSVRLIIVISGIGAFIALVANFIINKVDIPFVIGGLLTLIIAVGLSPEAAPKIIEAWLSFKNGGKEK